MPTLKVYYASWCPHCQNALKFLKKNKIDFLAVDIEKAPDDVVSLVVKVNGGDDWVVPTLEYEGRWRPGKAFDEDSFAADLKRMGVPFPLSAGA